MTNTSRKQLEDYWGHEIVAHCCRYWKLHYADGNWGRCGICHKRPDYVNMTWDELDKIDQHEHR